MQSPSLEYITAKCEVLNRANRILHHGHGLAMFAVLPYKGKKIRNADDSMCEPLRRRLNEVRDEVLRSVPDALPAGLQCRFELPCHSLFLVVSLDLKREGCRWEPIRYSRQACTVRDGKIEDVKDLSEPRCYSSSEVFSSLVALEESMKAAEDIKSRPCLDYFLRG